MSVWYGTKRSYPSVAQWLGTLSIECWFDGLMLHENTGKKCVGLLPGGYGLATERWIDGCRNKKKNQWCVQIWSLLKRWGLNLQCPDRRLYGFDSHCAHCLVPPTIRTVNLFCKYTHANRIPFSSLYHATLLLCSTVYSILSNLTSLYSVFIRNQQWKQEDCHFFCFFLNQC